MADPRPQASRAEIEEAIRAIREYHRQGRDSLRESAERGRYGQGALDEQAAELGWNVTRLRKARQFAHAEEGYSQEQLRELFGLLRKHRPLFGTAHVGILVTLSWAEGRAELQLLCAENNWSKATLEAEVKTRLGPRRQGGRWRQVGDEAGQLLTQLDALAHSWERWYGVASGTLGKAGQRRNVLPKLPPAVRRRVKAITEAMTGLRAKIAEKLGEIRAGETGP
jgi:hypothetical protein